MSIIREVEKIVEDSREDSQQCWRIAIETAETVSHKEWFFSQMDACIEHYQSALASMSELDKNWHQDALRELESASDLEKEGIENQHARRAIAALAAVEDQVHCKCGEWMGEPCCWTGPREKTVLVEYMPVHFRASHEASGNIGVYPGNGALRLRVEIGCAEMMFAEDGDWASLV